MSWTFQILSIAVALGLSSSAFAYQKEQPFTCGNPPACAKEGLRSGPETTVYDLAPSRLEIINKTNLIQTRLTDPKKFEEIRQNRLENSRLYQSWVDEVDAAFAGKTKNKVTPAKGENLYLKYFEGTPIDLAKKIAKKQMFLALQRSWPWLKDSIYNDLGAEVWHHAKPLKKNLEGPIVNETPSGSELTIERLNDSFVYSPRESRGQTYMFNFEFGGPNFVEINKNLRQGRAGIAINPDHDVNRLEDGVDKLKADDEDNGGGNSSGGGGNSGPGNDTGGGENGADAPAPDGSF